jgi:hypothetical protein
VNGFSKLPKKVYDVNSPLSPFYRMQIYSELTSLSKSMNNPVKFRESAFKRKSTLLCSANIFFPINLFSDIGKNINPLNGAYAFRFQNAEQNSKFHSSFYDCFVWSLSSGEKNEMKVNHKNYFLILLIFSIFICTQIEKKKLRKYTNMEHISCRAGIWFCVSF